MAGTTTRKLAIKQNKQNILFSPSLATSLDAQVPLIDCKPELTRFTWDPPRELQPRVAIQEETVELQKVLIERSSYQQSQFVCF